MQSSRFKHEFKRLNGVYVTDKVILFRNPLELYNPATGKIFASFDNLDEAMSFAIDGKTLEQRVNDWTDIKSSAERGGRGSSSGMGFFGGWPSAGGGKGKDETTADLPARMNVKIGNQRTYEDAINTFISVHGNADREHGIVIDAQGFVSNYRHGNADSISGLTGSNREIAVHNHPHDGWPTFSKEDVVNTALGSRRGIVAVSTKVGRSDDTARYAGTYTFTKGTHFKASDFVKAVNSAQLSGKDYNDAVNRWLKANQKKYGYTYSYIKAK